jgi:hypothetical protein
MILDHSDDNSADAYDVRFGSKADLLPSNCDVRFIPASGHRVAQNATSAACQERTSTHGRADTLDL